MAKRSEAKSAKQSVKISRIFNFNAKLRIATLRHFDDFLETN
jgi:hypothetical protein